MALSKGMYPAGRQIGAVAPVRINGAFRPNSSSGIVSGSQKGHGYSVARTSAGLYTLTFDEPLKRFMGCKAFVREADGREISVQAGDYDASAKTLQLRVGRPTGHIQLNLASAIIIAADVVQNTTEGGRADGNTSPSLQRVNSATDKALRMIWAAGNSAEVQFAPVMLPPDLDDASDVTVKLMMAKDTNTDTAAVVGISAWQGVGDTNMGGNTAALAVSTLASYSRTLAAADIAAYPSFLNISIIPGTHASDAIYLYAAAIEYVKKKELVDLAADADNEILFEVMSDESSSPIV